MSDVVAGQRQPTQGGLLPRAHRRQAAARYRLGEAEPVQLGLQQHSDHGIVLLLAWPHSAAAVPLGRDACDDLGDDPRGVHR